MPVSQAVKLRLRKKRAQTSRIIMRSLQVIKDSRLKQYEESISVEHFVRGIIIDCVDAVVEMVSAKRGNRLQYVEEKKEDIVASVVQKVTGKRKRKWNTWLERCYAIFMYVHPQIFNYNAMMTSAVLGISRSTLLGRLSTNQPL